MKNVSNFYNKKGWKSKNNITLDSKLFEDNRSSAKEYIKKCRLKIIHHIPKKGENFLDFASGPIQYKEYLKYSNNFKVRHCVDFSREALNIAKKKLKKRGKYYVNDFLKVKFKENYFDCSLSMHTIYHIDKNLQEKTVRKLLKITKPNKPVIIVYSNPNPLIKKIYSIFIKSKKNKTLYFYCHPIKWWKRFQDISKVEFYCWRSFSSQHQKMIFPNNFIGAMMFKILFYLENKFINFFYKNFQYPIIILKKK
tara:strand:- start:814 stop:1569 length:756 start_codon:yes stop_codon:yes gene_type:complete